MNQRGEVELRRKKRIAVQTVTQSTPENSERGLRSMTRKEKGTNTGNAA